MRDYLKDIVQHTYGLGIDTVKITGTASETCIDAIAEDRTVIVSAKFKNPVPEFIGIFGMPNLGKLNTILNISEYDEDANITILTQNIENVPTPSGITFENKVGDFKNEYRFMAANVISEVIKIIKFKGVTWGVDVVPTVASIQRLKFQASANSERPTFIARVENNDLKFYFGDHSSHSGNFVFHAGAGGTLSKPWTWPVQAVISILSLPGDKTIKFSDGGAAMITVDSGIAEYSYIIPAQQK